MSEICSVCGASYPSFSNCYKCAADAKSLYFMAQQQKSMEQQEFQLSEIQKILKEDIKNKQRQDLNDWKRQKNIDYCLSVFIEIIAVIQSSDLSNIKSHMQDWCIDYLLCRSNDPSVADMADHSVGIRQFVNRRIDDDYLDVLNFFYNHLSQYESLYAQYIMNNNADVLLINAARKQMEEWVQSTYKAAVKNAQEDKDNQRQKKQQRIANELAKHDVRHKTRCDIICKACDYVGVKIVTKLEPNPEYSKKLKQALMPLLWFNIINISIFLSRDVLFDYFWVLVVFIIFFLYFAISSLFCFSLFSFKEDILKDTGPYIAHLLCPSCFKPSIYNDLNDKVYFTDLLTK